MCKKAVEEHDMQCENRANGILTGLQVCPCCGAVIRSEQLLSIVPMVHTSQASNPPKSRVAYVLLGLFLGGLGIHNFYAGRPNRALGQLLTTLLVGWLVLPLVAVAIWCLVDICAITTDGDGVRFI